MSLSFFLFFLAYSQMLSGRDRKICSKGNLSVDWLRRHRLKQRRSINSKSPAEVDIMNAFERKKRSKYGEGGRDRRKYANSVREYGMKRRCLKLNSRKRREEGGINR